MAVEPSGTEGERSRTTLSFSCWKCFSRGGAVNGTTAAALTGGGQVELQGFKHLEQLPEEVCPCRLSQMGTPPGQGPNSYLCHSLGLS